MVKNPPANAGDTGDMGLIPRSERYPGEENGNPLQYSCLENSMDRGAWRGYSPWGGKESDVTEVTEHAAYSPKTPVSLRCQIKKSAFLEKSFK